MKNILIVAYYYPPLGGGGVQRTLKFAKYLNKMGYNISILTVGNDSSTVCDSSLSNDINNSIKIFRTEDKKVLNLRKIFVKKNTNSNNTITNKVKVKNNIFKRIKKNIVLSIKKILIYIYNNIYIPDEQFSWKKITVTKGIDIIRKEKIDIIYSTSGPYTDHLVAYELKKKTGIPWIADFRDAWVSNPFVDYSLLSKKINYTLEKKVVKCADAVISVSQPIINDFISRYGKSMSEKYYVLTNGYDETDFKQYTSDSLSKKFTIIYNGSLYGKRSPRNFLEAVSNLIEKNKIQKEDIIIQFVGEIGNYAMNDMNYFINKYDNILKFVNYLPHLQSIKNLENASSLLLIIEDGRGSNGIYTGKIFEYIRSGKNIIGVVPEGVAKELILETNTGFCAHPNKVEEIEDAVYNSYLLWKNKQINLDIKIDKIESYSRENLTKRLAEIIEKYSK